MLSQFNSRNSFAQILETFCLAVSRTSCIYFELLEILLLVSFKDLENKLCKHNLKEVVSVHYVKVYLKRCQRMILPLQKIHSRYFPFVCCLIYILLYRIFKDLAFRSSCLVPNTIDFVLFCVKCILILLSKNQSQKLQNSFQFQLRFYVGIIYKYHQH